MCPCSKTFWCSQFEKVEMKGNFYFKLHQSWPDTKPGMSKSTPVLWGEKMKVCLYGTETQISFELWASTESKKKIKKKKKVLILRAPFFLYKTMKVECQGTLCLSISFGANYRYMKCLLIISTVCKKKAKNIIFYTSPIFPQTLK